MREEELPPGYSGGVSAVTGTMKAFQYSYVDAVFRGLEKWHDAQVNITLAAAEGAGTLEAGDRHVYLSVDLVAFPNNASSIGNTVKRV